MVQFAVNDTLSRDVLVCAGRMAERCGVSRSFVRLNRRNVAWECAFSARATATYRMLAETLDVSAYVIRSLNVWMKPTIARADSGRQNALMPPHSNHDVLVRVGVSSTAQNPSQRE